MSVGVGFIGAGAHALHHMKEFSRILGARLIAVFDVDSSRSTMAASDFAGLCVADSLEELLANVDIQAVVIATPAETHRSLAEFALRAGKHVLLEKPMAHTADDALAILNASRLMPDRILLVGHCERFNSAYLDARRAIDDGRIGTPRFASASRLSPLRLNDPNWSLGVLDTAVHDIDIMLWLIGDLPVSVSARGVRVNPALATYDHVVYDIGFANGTLAQGHIGWVEFSGGYPMSGNAHPRLFLAGTDGSLTVDLWHRPVAVHTQSSGAYFWPDDVLVGYGDYATEVTALDAAFIRAISTNGASPIQPVEPYNALRVAHAAHLSLMERRGEPVGV